MSLVAQKAILLITSETRVNTVVVGGGITMISALCTMVRRVILKHRGKPQGGNTELLEVVEVLSYAFEVASVAQGRLGAVVGISTHSLYLVVICTA